jgi:predicted ATPase
MGDRGAIQRHDDTCRIPAENAGGNYHRPWRAATSGRHAIIGGKSPLARAFMAKKPKPILRAPFLKRLTLLPERLQADRYPFNLPILEDGRLELTFDHPITFLIGDNGTGKSTLLEAIAAHCGFNLAGGDRNHSFTNGTVAMPLVSALRLSWLPKVTDGFFLRAESYFNFATFLDDNYADPEIPPPSRPRFGTKELHAQSHGQSFFALFGNRIGDERRGIYLLDEPEAALAPTRQIEFLALLRKWEQAGNFQFIIATHSPIIMSYPNATLLSFDGGKIRRIAYADTDHYRVTRRFLMDHESVLQQLFAEDDPDTQSDDASED